MICNNAHLIIDGKFPEEFEQLLIHTAKLEFAMEVRFIFDYEKGTSIYLILLRIALYPLAKITLEDSIFYVSTL